jgi:hypothetical protein
VAIADVDDDGNADIIGDYCIYLNTGSLAPSAALTSGPRTTAPLTADSPMGARLSAKIAPNPLGRTGNLEFVLPESGRVQVALYDVSGRLVQVLAPPTWFEAGRHSLSLGDRSSALASGIYFYRVVTARGMASGRIVITSH